MANNTYHVQVTCQNCGRKSTYTMHSLIDTALDPMAEMNLFTGRTFQYTCPFCKAEQTITYSCLYHDGGAGVLIGFADSKTDEEEMRLMLGGQYHWDGMDEVLTQWLASCRVRLVTSLSELQEKVLTAHFNLDDRIIEIAKQLTMRIAEESETDIDRLLLNHSETGFSFVIVDKEGTASGEIPFSTKEYLLLEKRYGQGLMNVNEMTIDSAWAQEYLKSVDLMS